MQIDSYFTQQTDVKSIILEHLDNAETTVFVAVAWFTDTTLFKKLLELQDKGIRVEVIITNHEFNHNSYNDYGKIDENGGYFSMIGNDIKLMHMKFCIIDFNTVISGSANWSKKAFSTNNEEVTIVIDNLQRANEFVTEFKRLKEISSKIDDAKEPLTLQEIYKHFKLIKAFLDIGEANKMQPYIYKLEDHPDIASIVELLKTADYDKAVDEMNAFEKERTILVDITAIEKQQLLNQINLISFQLESLEIKKADVERILEQFNHRYILELNPLISKILQLKRKIYKKLERFGFIDENFKNVDEAFHQTNEDYAREKEINIPDLNETDTRSIKELYREASKYCHPDSLKCVIEDKDEASVAFTALTEAYKSNDIELVRSIHDDLTSKNPSSNISSENELEKLSLRFESLKEKYKRLKNELEIILCSDEYISIIAINDWDLYFKDQKEKLLEEYLSLEKEYTKDE
ncbi:hypothetical protein AAT17_12595 [Nonlabens sp. MIC269]|uniref:phospholipase D-like domain-containing protein n=1 Tax=Nonlabens sp. MIC269 TaxID=1476901 RepID=UPI000721C814|nr:phospholipase D-like domain-containing protein [Nonlabens sp. MIC269]ALM22009.1 hypothetical protein AAT17_12595 [Nonlabens sp. MIC269]